MQKIAVFYNQHASQSSKNWIEEVREVLFRSELSFYQIPRPRKLKRLVLDVLDTGIEIIVCVGGDGSMNLMIQELAYKPIHFLLIPAGTANDLARELGIVKRVVDSILAVRKSTTKKIDLIDINGRFFATNGGIGLGAGVTDLINSVRAKYPITNLLLKVFKHKIYTLVLSFFSLMPSLKYYKINVKSDQFTGDLETPFVFILNQTTVAGSVQLAPDSSNCDGYFHVVIFKHKKRIDLIKCFVRILQGHIPKEDPDFIDFSTQEVTLTSLDSTDILYFGDGEILGDNNIVTAKVMKEALSVYLIQSDMDQ